MQKLLSLLLSHLFSFFFFFCCLYFQGLQKVIFYTNVLEYFSYIFIQQLHFVKKQLFVCGLISFVAVVAPLIYIPVLMPVLHCFNYYNFVECLEVMYFNASSLIFLIQDYFGFSGPFVI